MPTYISPLILKLLTISVLATLAWSKVSPSVCATAHVDWLPACDDTGDWFNLATNAAAIFSTLLLLFQTWLWRTWIGRKAFGWPIPNLNGTWRGTLTPGAAPAGVPLSGPLLVYLVIHQTAFGFRATLHTKESRSHTVAAEFTRLNDDVELVYSYYNTPHQNIQERSPVHYGTTVLRMASEKSDCLNGLYYTQRLTRGELSFDGRTDKQAHDFVEAEALTYTSRGLPCTLSSTTS